MQHQEAAIAEAKPTNHFVRINGLKLHYFDWGGANRRHMAVQPTPIGGTMSRPSSLPHRHLPLGEGAIRGPMPTTLPPSRSRLLRAQNPYDLLLYLFTRTELS
jgi:hypothetical protein